MRLLATILTATILLLPAGCTPALDAITAPNLTERLATAQPIRPVTPLATVYAQSIWENEVTVDWQQSRALTEAVREGLAAALTKKGWPVAQLAAIEWGRLGAGTDLADAAPLPAAGPAGAADRILRRLDAIGRHLRTNERVEGIHTVDRQVDPADSALLSGRGGSLLFAVVVGCDGRLSDGPCREIQSPPIQTGNYGYGTFSTVPAGMALHLYWVDGASGRLLWYDTTRTFNAVSASAPHINAIIADTLAEFPAPR